MVRLNLESFLSGLKLSLIVFIQSACPYLFATTPPVIANTAQQVEAILARLPPQSHIFFDIDDTLITPKSVFFRVSSPYRNLIEDIKRNKNSYSNYEEIISNWRLQRKIVLTSSKWPELIDQLKAKHFVYGLTQMIGGSFGEIKSMEEWRLRELSEKRILFTSKFNSSSHFTLLQAQRLENSALFYHGLFLTGSYQKGEVVKEIASRVLVTQVVLIDDREDHLLNVAHICKGLSISYLGILYKGVQQLPEICDPKVAEFQKNHLLKNATWLEDDEAKELLFKAKP